MTKSAILDFRRNPLLVFLCIPALALNADEIASHQQFLYRYCVRCHGPASQKGDIRLDHLTEVDPSTLEVIYEQLADGLMPPDDQRQPASNERERMMRHVLELAKRESVVTDPGLRRLNKREYANTVRDLLGLHQGIFDPGEYIYDDDVDEGFDTAAKSLIISNELLLEYMDAADKSLRHALFTDETSRPEPRVIDVNVGRMKGIGGGRYINNHKHHVVCRSGGKAMVYDGLSTRTMRIPGRYTITVTASAIDRDTYPVRFIPEQGPLVIGIGVQQDVAASVSAKPQVLKMFELQDDIDQTFTFNVWIDKDHFPYLSFVNGSKKPITQLRANIRRGKIDPSEANNPYRGPGVRIRRFQIEGPFIDRWPPASIRTTFDTDQIPELSDPAVRQEVVLRFAKRAFRRRVTEQEVVPYLAYMDRQHRSGVSWHEAVVRTFAAMMSSVDFLYIREQQGDLDAYELASRLSYFFWSTMPDDQLFKLAESGKLVDDLVGNPRDQANDGFPAKSTTLSQQVLRLLSDPRSEQFCTSFAEQWLALDKLGTMPPDTKGEFRVYYRENLQTAMLQETHCFFQHVLRENRSVREFLDSDYSFVNKSLADLYGLKVVDFARNPSIENRSGSRGQAIPANPTTDPFVRVTFPRDAKRGGLLGHASILTLSANGVDTSPIERGVWVLAELLGTPPPPPPKAVPALTPDLNGAVTVREMLEKHRSDPACMECHRRMDPLGFALEAYDPIGRLRSKYSKTQAVSTHGNYLGRDFADVTELKQILSGNIRPFARNLIVRIAEYAKGRKLIAADYATVEAILSATEKSDYRLKDLVTWIATSDLMTKR